MSESLTLMNILMGEEMVLIREVLGRCARARESLRDAFGVDVGGGYVEAARLLNERSAGQCKLKLERVLNAVGRLGGE